jgi:hypothetical protein
MVDRRRLVALVLAAFGGCAFEPAGGSGLDDGVDADVATAADASTDPSTPLVCPAGYAPIHASKTQYRIVEVNVPWATAAADCNDDGEHTHLVVVGDPLEKTALTNQFSGNTWVGLTDATQEGSFVWVTNEATNGFPLVGQRPPWDAGDPDGGAAENCVRFKNTFDFEDKPCGELNSYVCECDPYAPR